MKVHVLCISGDDREKSQKFWEQELGRKFAVLSDPGAKTIRAYGILDEGEDIALDTTLFVGPDGRERWRHVSATLPDLPTAEQTLKRVRQSLQGDPARAK